MMSRPPRPSAVTTAVFLLCLTLCLRATAAAPAKSAAQKPAKGQTGSALDIVVHALFGVKSFEQAAISSDGRQVAWVESVPGGKSAIYVSEPRAGASPRRITAGTGASAFAEGSVAWSPDSRRLAFLSDAAQAGQQQLFAVNLAGGPAKKLTSVKGYLATPGWSPDGKTLAFLFTENATRAAGPLVAETAQTGVIKDAVTEQRLALVDAAGGKLRQISPADMYVYEYDWSPDGKRFVTTAAHGNGDDNWYIAEIYAIDAAGGEMKSIYKPPLQIANPAWSPDGKSVAFIGGLMSDEPSVGGDVFMVSAAGGEAKNLTPGIKASASWLAWMKHDGPAGDGGKILLGEDVDGGSALATLDPDSGTVNTLWQTGDHVSLTRWGTSVSVSADGKMGASIRQSFAHGPEIWAGPIGALQPVTSRNAALKPGWGEAKSIHWSNEGFNLQGWLLYPRDFDPAKKYPMVVQIHGGPSLMARSSWPAFYNFGITLSGMGYFVLFPNYRGSYGEGEAFTIANVKDMGYGDFRDIMTGVDQALKEAPIDEHRMGITGWSYGGYMSMWAVTQTNRFAAAVAGAGVANYLSYYGENQIDQWMIPFFGKTVYEDPEVYARSSPITFITKAKTPTLVLVGDSDGECPTPQSYEFWHALKTLGVETELVVYEHEGHIFADPNHQRDLVKRAAEWFNQHLK